MEEINAFIEELVKLCQKHGMVISSQDEDDIMILRASDFDQEHEIEKHGATTRPHISYIAPSGMIAGRID